MEPEARVVEGRRRRRRAEAEQLVAEYETSGLGREEFCRQHGLSLATLARYRKRQRQAEGEAAGPGRWLAVEVSRPVPVAGSGAGSGLAVVLARGRRLEIGCGFDAPTLVQLLALLERA